MKTWFWGCHLAGAATALLLSVHSLGAAQSIVHDIEPNDTPDAYQAVAGEVRIIGTMPSQDQDGFLWTIDEPQSLRPWTFTLQGLPGDLTTVDMLQLQYAEDGQAVTGTRKLFTMRSPDGTRPIVASGLLFEPGEYALGFARAGAGGLRAPKNSGALGAMGEPFGATHSNTDASEQSTENDEQSISANGYRLDITGSHPLHLSKSRAVEQTREKPLVLRLDDSSAILAIAAKSWYRFTLNEAAAGQRWDLAFRTTVGQTLKADLQGPDGNTLASTRTDAQGQAQFRDLSLAQGDYFLLLDGAQDALQVVTLSAAGLKVDGEEGEPNDDWKNANRVDLFQGVSGSLQVERDADFYRFELTEGQTSHRLALSLETKAEDPYTICLLNDQGRDIHCRTPVGDWQLTGLVLEAGVYGVKVLRGKTGLAYRLSVQSDGEHNAGLESQPNESIKWATTVQLGKRIRGGFDMPDDTDFYRVDVEGDPQRWRFQVNGENLRELIYYDGRGRRLQTVHSRTGAKRLALDSLYLAPGTHYISIRGSDKGDYLLLSRAQGLPDPNAEIEPNDSAQNMLPLKMEQIGKGGFHDPSDQDKYYFQLTNHDHISLALQAPQDEGVKMRAILEWEGKTLKDVQLTGGQETALEGVYPPGSYVLTLSTNQTTESQYSVSLTRLARYSCPIDCEPNDHAAFSSPLPADGRISGQADPALYGETDWYALPVRGQDTTWHFATASKAALFLRLNQEENAQTLRRASTDAAYQVSVPANRQAYLVVSPKEPYEIQALPDGQPLIVEAPLDLSELTLSLELPAQTLAAYAQLGQQLEGTIRLSNAGPQPVSLTLEAVTSDLEWLIALPENSVEVPAASNREVPVQIQVPADARAQPVVISVRAAHATGSSTHTQAKLAALPDAPLIAPRQYWAVPEALRGGLNLAAASLGGKVLPGEKTDLHRNSASLIDGVVGSSNEFTFQKQKLPHDTSVTIELAGDGTAPIAGIALNPFSHLPMHRAPQQFSVALSNDGTQFDTVLEDILEPVRREQYFVLPTTRSARFARLTIHQNYNGDWAGETALGEWQVIAKPGTTLAADTPFNLAERRHGGHVVDAYPADRRTPHWIDPSEKTYSHRGIEVAKSRQAYWVLGFHHNRAARIDRIVWGKGRTNTGEPIEQVEILASVHGPVGPWTSIGRLEPKLEEEVQLQLPEAVWARYLRFELLPVAEKHHTLVAPTSVQVYEALTDEQYRSVLGLWSDTTRAIYEDLHPAAAPSPLDPDISHGVRAQAQALAIGQHANGQVQLDNQEHWYRVRIPEGNNQLDIQLSDPLYLKAALSVETPAGEPLLLTPVQAEGNQRHWTVSAQPGAELLIKVFEPPRNVIFAWDTSGSVRKYHEQTYNAIGEYARGLRPKRDMANLLPFAGKLQLQDWQGDPYLMLQAVNEHEETDSSAAESTLITASNALATRSGSRAVVLLTDAETTIDHDLWPALAKGQPQIIAVALGSPGHTEKQLMLNWSRVNGGHYSMAHDVNDMAQAFDRASVLLRQPAPYQLHVDAALVEPPADGALHVVAAPIQKGDKASVHSGPVTAIILDASGSMLQRLDGERRIEIAKRGLMQAISEQIPPGTPVSLRVFGHKEANSCRTDLELPLQPLDVAAARKVVGQIQAKNLARTPIADSLSLVRQDLAKAKGPRTIVLVTDGEETCDGDPEAVIKELISDGFDVRLNIIGFALDDPILEEIFGAWARLGGGEYFSAADKQSFDQAVGKALQASYTVLNAAGTVVAQGQVDGEPIFLPPGNYQVKVGLVPELVFETVQVDTKETTTLEVK